jgi:chromosome segregation ATPase
MCIGGSSQPQVVYSGPSAEEAEAQRQQLQTYQRQSAAQQEQLAAELKKQIDQTNAQAEQQRQQLEDERRQLERAATAASTVAQRQASYSVTNAEADPALAQTTQAAAPKKKLKSSLRIASGSVESTAGSGLNIGI